jgi:hypothetical protein
VQLQPPHCPLHLPPHLHHSIDAHLTQSRQVTKSLTLMQRGLSV